MHVSELRVPMSVLATSVIQLEANPPFTTFWMAVTTSRWVVGRLLAAVAGPNWVVFSS
jgi:hypothetical protein